MKYKELKTYQAVKFHAKGHETFFSIAVKGFETIKMEDSVWGVRVTNENDDIIISYNNISYAKVDDSEKPKKESKPVTAKA